MQKKKVQQKYSILINSTTKSKRTRYVLLRNPICHSQHKHSNK